MSDKTEAPTPRRLEEAREEGNVPRSLELNSAAILLAGALLLKGPGTGLVAGLKELLSETATSLTSMDLTEAWLRNWSIEQLWRLAPSLGIVLLGLLGVGVAVTLAQTRFLWSSKRMGFDFKRINPLSGLQRIFSGQGLVELARSLLKLVLIGYVAYSFLQSQVTDLLQLSQMDFIAALESWVGLAGSLAVRIGAAYLVLAIADYVYQRWAFMRQLKMTKEEVKEEMKRSEGDPFLRSRIRAQQRRIARNRMMANVHKASVVITNPTHFAIAIAYDPGTMSAPRVLAKGAYAVAQRIADLARKAGIPVIQNIPLARALYRTVEIDQEIPPDLYVAVAEVLAYVYRLRGKTPRPSPAAL